MVSQSKLIKNGIRYTDALFDEIIRRVNQGVLDNDTLESFLEDTKEYTTNNPLVSSGYADTMLRLILSETNNHRFSRPSQRELTRLTIENYVGDLIVDVGDDVKQTIRSIVTEEYNAGSNPQKIAKRITQEVGTIKNKRARAIARTEIARVSTVSDYIIAKERGATHYTVSCRSTRCDKCKALYCKTNDTGADVEYEIEDTEHLPPLHVNCRCSPNFYKKKGGSEIKPSEEPKPSGEVKPSKETKESKKTTDDSRLWEDLAEKHNLEFVNYDGATIELKDPKHNTPIKFHTAQNKEWIDYTNKGKKNINFESFLEEYNSMPSLHKQAIPELHIKGNRPGMQGEFVIGQRSHSEINIYKDAYVYREGSPDTGHLSMTLRHESSHAIDAKFIYDPTLSKMSGDFWFSGNHKELENGAYRKAISKDRRNRKKTGGQNYVSEYARTSGSYKEDFAEALSLRSFRDAPPEVRAKACLWEDRGGKLVKVSYDDFEKMYPNRCKVLDEVLDNYTLGW